MTWAATGARGGPLLIWSSAAAFGGAALAALLLERRRRRHHWRRLPPALAAGPYAAQLRLAVRMALQAGANMAPHLAAAGTSAAARPGDAGALRLSIKNDRPEDFFTQVDLRNERLCVEMVQEAFPLDRIIGEEEASEASEIPPLTREPTWIVDPIDGTTNFAAGLPLCCVSIGYCVDAAPVAGVVYAPATGELYTAAVGGGAYRNGVRITGGAPGPRRLLDAVVGFEFGYARGEDAVERMVGAVHHIMLNGCRTLRCLGSGVLDLCYVATGRLDLVYGGIANEGWKPWDYCAGYVIATESGCVVEAIPRDKVFDLYSDSVVCAANKELINDFRNVIKV